MSLADDIEKLYMNLEEEKKAEEKPQEKQPEKKNEEG